MANYLIVWGEASNAIRSGSGADEKQAAKEAFGCHDAKRQTIMKVKLSVMRSDSQRIRFIAQILLPEHARRMAAIGEDAAAKEAYAKIQEITKAWQKSWNSVDKRKLRS